MNSYRFAFSVPATVFLCCAALCLAVDSNGQAPSPTLATAVAVPTSLSERREGDSPKLAEDSALSGSTFSTRVREVNVVFSVSDWRGRFLSHLSPSEFNVLDNGESPSDFTYFVEESASPLRIGIAVDVSDSTRSYFRAEQNAAVLFLQQTLRPADSGFVAEFSRRPRITQQPTPNLELLTKAIQKLRPGGDATAIHDAVKFLCERLVQNRDPNPTRSALILITDGQENSSHVSLDDALFAALQADVTVFAVNTSPPSLDDQAADRLLKRLTESTGGKAFRAGSRWELKKAFGEINRQLRNQYILGYKPPHWVADRSFHQIRLMAKRRRMRVHCRKGYYAVD